MTFKDYSGSCHCGCVRYEARIDLAKGTMRCNCSICSKARAWFALVPAGDLRIAAGEAGLADYQWTPAGMPAPHLHYRFCKTCGVRVFAQGNLEALGGAFYAVAVATLDDAGADDLAASIRYLDGRNGHYDRQPEDTRLL